MTQVRWYTVGDLPDEYQDDGWLTNEWVRPGVVGGDTVPRNRYLSRSQVKHIDRARTQSQAQVDETLWLGTYHPRPKKLKFTHLLRRLLYSDRRWYRYLERLMEKER